MLVLQILLRVDDSWMNTKCKDNQPTWNEMRYRQTPKHSQKTSSTVTDVMINERLFNTRAQVVVAKELQPADYWEQESEHNEDDD